MNTFTKAELQQVYLALLAREAKGHARIAEYALHNPGPMDTAMTDALRDTRQALRTVEAMKREGK